MQQLQAMQQAQQAQQKTQPILDEINREVGSLSLDEQKVLATMQEYQMAKSTYEAGFMAFLGNKFSQEYVASPDGYVTNIFGKPVKFNDEDVTQLLNLFKQFKQNK